jgi:hypothetical protein
VRARHVTTAVTLLVLIGILVAGGILGLKSLFAPLPATNNTQARPSASCDPTAIRKGQRIRARQVQVSVFNAGDRTGLAGLTMAKLHHRGFRTGRVGNAPSDAGVRRVQVWTTRRDDVAARLVARQFGRHTRVRFVDTDLGPGVDVVVGNHFRGLVKASRSPSSVRAHQRTSACLPNA